MLLIKFGWKLGVTNCTVACIWCQSHFRVFKPMSSNIYLPEVRPPFHASILLITELFEMLITNMMVICGASENENIRLGKVRLDRVRFAYDVFLFLFVPEMNVIVGTTTSNNSRINKIYA